MRAVPKYGVLLCLFLFVQSQCLSLEIVETRNTSSIIPIILASSESNWGELACEDVYSISNREQCSFINEKCNGEEYQLGSLNIFKFYYCSSSHKSIRDLIILPIVTLFLISIFAILGVIASNFLCPNLSNISTYFNIPDNLSGLTLLAFGNGSPDILGTYASFNSGNTSLAIGELIGAGFFITCFIIGLMAIVHPFEIIGQEKFGDINNDNDNEELNSAEKKNDKLVYIRDLTIFIASVITLIVVLYDGKLTRSKCLILCFIYLIYVLIILLWNWIFKTKQLNVINDNKIRLMYNDESILNIFGNSDDDFSDRYEIVNEGTARISSSGSTNQSRNSLFDSFEFSNVFNELQSRQSFPLSFITGQRSHKIKRGDINSSHIYRDTELQADESTYESLHASFHEDGDEDEDEEENDDPPHQIYDNFTRQYMESQRNEGSHLPTNELLSDKLVLKRVVLTAFSTTLMYISYPIQYALSISIPVRVQSDMVHEEDIHLKLSFNQLASLCSQLMIFPALFFFAFLRDSSTATKILVPLFLQFTCCLFFYFSYKTLTLSSSLISFSRIRLINITLSFIGFIASISWISILAQELINILKFISIFSRMSEAILGLTVFAMGNSIGDLISNITMAKMGYPLMALAACFGGPLLNLLLGIGMNGLLISNDSFMEFRLSPSLKITCICLLSNLFFLLLYVPIKGWKFDRSTGLIMVCIWSGCTTINVLIELLT